jgi:hypothetical protein
LVGQGLLAAKVPQSPEYRPLLKLTSKYGTRQRLLVGQMINTFFIFDRFGDQKSDCAHYGESPGDSESAVVGLGGYLMKRNVFGVPFCKPRKPFDGNRIHPQRVRRLIFELPVELITDS